MGELQAEIQRAAKIPDATVRALVVTAAGPDQTGDIAPFVAAGVPVIVQQRVLDRLVREAPVARASAARSFVAYENDYQIRFGEVEVEVEHVGRGRTGARVRRVLLPERGAAGRRRTMSWHGAVGVWALVGVLALAATGLTWSAHAGQNIGTLRQALNWQTPSLSAEVFEEGHHGEGGADRLAGGPGVDRLDGGSGRDRVDGGIGRDQCMNAERRERCP